jgi:hypothetical protein
MPDFRQLLSIEIYLEDAEAEEFLRGAHDLPPSDWRNVRGIMPRFFLQRLCFPVTLLAKPLRNNRLGEDPKAT